MSDESWRPRGLARDLGAATWAGGTFILLPMGLFEYFFNDGDYRDAATLLLFAIGFRLIGVNLMRRGTRL